MTGNPGGMRQGEQAKAESKRKKLTIEELEEILNRDDEVPFQILPSGEIRRADPKDLAALGPKVPLTMRENLGGEYGQ